MSKIDGYAFTTEYKLESAKRFERYKEIEHLRKTVVTDKQVKYGHHEYKGVIPPDIELSDLDLLLLCDEGNTCFGGSVNRSGDTFTANVWTD